MPFLGRTIASGFLGSFATRFELMKPLQTCFQLAPFHVDATCNEIVDALAKIEKLVDRKRL
jgi:hypothetical protein